MSKIPETQTAAIAIEGNELVIRLRLAHVAADELVKVDACGLEVQAVHKLIAAGTLKAVRIGRSLHVRKSDLVALVDKLPGITPKKRKAPVKGAKIFSFAEAVKQSR